VFQSPNIEALVVVEKRVDHLLLAQLKNWLNPAMVGEVTRLQQHGYTLVFVSVFRP
jgi:hypothetical protein